MSAVEKSPCGRDDFPLIHVAGAYRPAWHVSCPIRSRRARGPCPNNQASASKNPVAKGSAAQGEALSIPAREVIGMSTRNRLRTAECLIASAFVCVCVALTGNVFAQGSGHHAGAPVEEERDVEGVVTILYEDSPSGARLQYVLDTVEERLSLQFPDGPPPGLASHARIRVHGVQVEATLLAYSAGTTSSSTTQTSAPAAMPNTFGALRAAVLLVNFR